MTRSSTTKEKQSDAVTRLPSVVDELEAVVSANLQRATRLRDDRLFHVDSVLPKGAVVVQ
jgi:hypothetical protein